MDTNPPQSTAHDPASRKPPVPMSGADILELTGLAVLLRAEPKSKQPKGKWKHLRLANMTPEYLSGLWRGNIGVALGEVSCGLCAIDIDRDDLVDPFLAVNPGLAGTLQTHGSRGRVFWFRCAGDYPKRILRLKTPAGDPAGEFRSSGCQSIIYGTHPAGNRYTFISKAPAVTITFASIRWPDGIIPDGLAKLPPEGKLPEGDVSDGCIPVSVCKCDDGVVMGELGKLDETVKSNIHRAVKLAMGSHPHQNNVASFTAARLFLTMCGTDDLSQLSRDIRRYFAEHWFKQLSTAGRVTAGKSKTHYMNDILEAIKNVKRIDTMNTSKIKSAWLKAQVEPLPPEANYFHGDEIMQRFIALCYQLHVQADKGEWFLARNKAAKLMGLTETQARNLSENFKVLIECGILEIVASPDKDERKATGYVYHESATIPAVQGDDGNEK